MGIMRIIQTIGETVIVSFTIKTLDQSPDELIIKLTEALQNDISYPVLNIEHSQEILEAKLEISHKNEELLAKVEEL